MRSCLTRALNIFSLLFLCAQICVTLLEKKWNHHLGSQRNLTACFTVEYFLSRVLRDSSPGFVRPFVSPSIRRSAGWSHFTSNYDFYALTSLILPIWSNDLKYGPCPPARDLGSLVHLFNRAHATSCVIMSVGRSGRLSVSPSMRTFICLSVILGSELFRLFLYCLYLVLKLMPRRRRRRDNF